MISESFTTTPAEAEGLKEWYFSNYHPWAYQASLASTTVNPDGTVTLTFTRARHC